MTAALAFAGTAGAGLQPKAGHGSEAWPQGLGSGPAGLRPAVFIDKDGTLIEDLPYNGDPVSFRFTPHALQALQALDRAGFALVVVTNQPGLASGRCTRAAFAQLQQALTVRVRNESGVELTGFHICPHAPAGRLGVACLCRKPAPGLLLQAARRHSLDLPRSWMIGDLLDDVEAGRRAGTRSILLDRGHETEWRLSPLRTPHLRCPTLLDAAHAIVEEYSFPDPRLAGQPAFRVHAE